MGCIVKLYDEYTIPDYDYSYLYHNEFASRFSIWVLMLLLLLLSFSFILSRFICSYKSWIAECLCFKNIFPKQLVADFELLYYASFIPFEFSGGFDFFLPLFADETFSERRTKWLNFVCMRIKIRSKRMEVIHEICTHIRCDLWLWQMWYVKRETLQALLIYLDLELWSGSHMKRRYFIFA